MQQLNVIMSLGWSGDFNGDECGYPEVGVVGHWIGTTMVTKDGDLEEASINYYIDAETGFILESWISMEDE